jgi:hypothetical protein
MTNPNTKTFDSHRNPEGDWGEYQFGKFQGHQALGGQRALTREFLESDLDKETKSAINNNFEHQDEEYVEYMKSVRQNASLHQSMIQEAKDLYANADKETQRIDRIFQEPDEGQVVAGKDRYGVAPDMRRTISIAEPIPREREGEMPERDREVMLPSYNQREARRPLEQVVNLSTQFAKRSKESPWDEEDQEPEQRQNVIHPDQQGLLRDIDRRNQRVFPEKAFQVDQLGRSRILGEYARDRQENSSVLEKQEAVSMQYTPSANRTDITVPNNIVRESIHEKQGTRAGEMGRQFEESRHTVSTGAAQYFDGMRAEGTERTVTTEVRPKPSGEIVYVDRTDMEKPLTHIQWAPAKESSFLHKNKEREVGASALGSGITMDIPGGGLSLGERKEMETCREKLNIEVEPSCFLLHTGKSVLWKQQKLAADSGFTEQEEGSIRRQNKNISALRYDKNLRAQVSGGPLAAKTRAEPIDEKTQRNGLGKIQRSATTHGFVANKLYEVDEDRKRKDKVWYRRQGQSFNPGAVAAPAVGTFMEYMRDESERVQKQKAVPKNVFERTVLGNNKRMVGVPIKGPGSLRAARNIEYDKPKRMEVENASFGTLGAKEGTTKQPEMINDLTWGEPVPDLTNPQNAIYDQIFEEHEEEEERRKKQYPVRPGRIPIQTLDVAQNYKYEQMNAQDRTYGKKIRPVSFIPHNPDNGINMLVPRGGEKHQQDRNRTRETTRQWPGEAPFQKPKTNGLLHYNAYEEEQDSPMDNIHTKRSPPVLNNRAQNLAPVYRAVNTNHIHTPIERNMPERYETKKNRDMHIDLLGRDKKALGMSKRPNLMDGMQ